MLQPRHCTRVVTGRSSTQQVAPRPCSRQNTPSRRLSANILHDTISKLIKKAHILSVCFIGTLVIGINPAIGSQEELQSFSTQDATVSEEISLVQLEEKQQSEDSLPSSDNAPADTNEQTTKVSKKRGRIRELEEIKAQLAQKELELMSKENALLEKEQSMLVLRQELEIERNLRALITKEKEQAEEEAALAMGLCLL